MVKISKFPPRPKTFDDVNPFGIVYVIVDGVQTNARTIEYDSEPVTDNILNAKGEPVKPLVVQTACPSCGTGITTPYSQLQVSCQQCHPPVTRVVTPAPIKPMFINPVLAGITTLLPAPIIPPTDLGEELDA
jgi:hypothetical protein